MEIQHAQNLQEHYSSFRPSSYWKGNNNTRCPGPNSRSCGQLYGAQHTPITSKMRLKVVAFITKRLEMKESWVMYYQLYLPTRGCSTTQRVESDHGTTRDAGVDARTSWLLSLPRMHAILDKRRTLTREWCDRHRVSRGALSQALKFREFFSALLRLRSAHPRIAQ